MAPLEPSLLGALTVARENVAAVARAQVEEGERLVTLPQGQRVTLREAPVRSAAVHVPGGRAPYPSTAVMGVTAARVAGVERVVVCTPPRPRDGAVLGAAALCGADEVYRMGGAQAIAALAYGTESVEAVDVIVGPGNAYVTEAKRQVFGRVGIDALAGPERARGGHDGRRLRSPRGRSTSPRRPSTARAPWSWRSRPSAPRSTRWES
ncbi:MAG: histidinol dehydrogenase [Thermoleophilaceae bacterium]